jgi:modulator of FtsH protease
LEVTTLADWSAYLSTWAECSATLTGLVFVAVSINLARIVETPGLPGRAAESLIQLFGVLLISAAGLVPKQSLRTYGVHVLVLAILSWVMQTVSQIHYVRQRTRHPHYWLWTRVTQTQLATIPFSVSAILMMHDSPAGLYWVAPAAALSVVAGVISAWVLLIEIVR